MTMPIMVETARDMPRMCNRDVPVQIDTGFPFDDDDFSSSNRNPSFRSKLDNIVKNHPELAEHLNLDNFPFNSTRPSSSWSRARRGSDESSSADPFAEYRRFHTQRPFRSTFDKDFPFNSPSSSRYSQNPEGRYREASTQAENTPPQEEEAQKQKEQREEEKKPPQVPQSDRGRKQNIQQSNTVDLGQKQEPVNENRSQRSMSAPPDNRNNQRFVSSINIPINPEGNSEMGQRQSQETQPTESRTHERVIPIHVEGRDEPVIPRHAQQQSQQPPPQTERIFGSNPQPDRMFGSNPQADRMFGGNFPSFYEQPHGFRSSDEFFRPFPQNYQQYHQGYPPQNAQGPHPNQHQFNQGQGQHGSQMPHQQKQDYQQFQGYPQNYQQGNQANYQSGPQPYPGSQQNQQAQHGNQGQFQGQAHPQAQFHANPPQGQGSQANFQGGPQGQPIPQPNQQPPQQNQSPPKQEEAQQPQDQMSKSLTQIQAIQKDVLELMTQVEGFTGKPRDKQYIYLDEMLTRNMLKLDNIETEGKDVIRQARKQAISCIEKCISILEAKANANLENANPQVENEKMEVEAQAEPIKEASPQPQQMDTDKEKEEKASLEVSGVSRSGTVVEMGDKTEENNGKKEGTPETKEEAVASQSQEDVEMQNKEESESTGANASPQTEKEEKSAKKEKKSKKKDKEAK